MTGLITHFELLFSIVFASLTSLITHRVFFVRSSALTERHYSLQTVHTAKAY